MNKLSAKDERNEAGSAADRLAAMAEAVRSQPPILTGAERIRAETNAAIEAKNAPARAWHDACENVELLRKSRYAQIDNEAERQKREVDAELGALLNDVSRANGWRR